MRALAELTVGADPGGRPHRVERMVPSAPIGWRLTPDAVYMVATAASPVADDDVRVAVGVGAGAALRVRSASATVAWRSHGSHHHVAAELGPGAELVWTPEPLVATAGCDHHQAAHVSMAPGARLVWAEQLVLGRHGEGPGSLRSTLAVDAGGRPLLRHALGVGAGWPGWDAPSVLGPASMVGLVLVAGAGAPTAPSRGEGWAAMPLDGPGLLGLAVTTSAPAMDRAMAELLALAGTG